MNFTSLREYFYKIANRCYLLVLLPLAIFIFVYHRLQTYELVPFVHDELLIQMVEWSVVALAIINLTTVHWLSKKRLKKYATEVGLANKLDRYYEVVMLRMKSISASALLMAVGEVMTGSEWIGVAVILILLWTPFQWPTAARACRDLSLKGDEYEMVFYKKDRF